MEDETKEVITDLQDKLMEYAQMAGELRNEIEHIKKYYIKYWHQLSPDAVPRPDVMRAFENDMNRIREALKVKK